MRRVTLPRTSINTTALGFGTASMMGKLGKNESLRLLHVAYEHGIRHFDTAPLYGDGEAEAVLGRFLRNHPDITVATKLGLARAHKGSFIFTRGKQIARPILRLVPSLRKVTRNAVDARAPLLVDFRVESAAASLAESLRLLGREYIDILLLHECRASDLQDDKLLDFLLRARERGQIKEFGIATDIETIKHCLDSVPAYASVIQFSNNASEPNIERTPALTTDRACITHSPFRGFRTVDHNTPKAALAYATSCNPNGIVLFGSQSSRHIVDNVLTFT